MLRKPRKTFFAIRFHFEPFSNSPPVKVLKIPVWILPLRLMWLCRTAFLRMSPNIYDCTKSAKEFQMRCTIEGNSIHSWRPRILDGKSYGSSMARNKMEKIQKSEKIVAEETHDLNKENLFSSGIGLWIHFFVYSLWCLPESTIWLGPTHSSIFITTFKLRR